MKLRLILTLLVLIMLTACGAPQPAVPATAPAAVPTTAPEVKPTEAPTQVLPTATLAPTATKPAATKPPAAPTNTVAPQPTDTATAAPTAAPPRPTPTSSGPLAAQIYVANCRSAPTTEKPGQVVVQISVEASGGNGRYHYFYQDKEAPTKFIEVPGEKGTRLIGEVKVTSDDGQELKKEFDIAVGTLNCP
jgi:hypothetical protein